VASIELSQAKLCKTQEEGAKNSVYFVIFRNGKLFQGDGDSKEEEDESKDGKDQESYDDNQK
jgi:hypothetical protein